MTIATAALLSGTASAQGWSVKITLNPITDEKEARLLGSEGDCCDYISWLCIEDEERLTFGYGGFNEYPLTIRIDNDPPWVINNMLGILMAGSPKDYQTIDRIVSEIPKASKTFVAKRDSAYFVIPAKGSTAAYDKARPICDNLRERRGD